MDFAIRSRLASGSERYENRFRANRGKRIAEHRTRTFSCDRGRGAERDHRAARGDGLQLRPHARFVQRRRRREARSRSRSSSPGGCAWTVTGAPSWVTVSPASGSGSATLKIAAAANSGPARVAELIVGGREFRVEQAQLPACTYAVTPDQLTVSRKKQHEEIEVKTHIPLSMECNQQRVVGARIVEHGTRQRDDRGEGRRVRPIWISICGRHHRR